MSNKQKTLTFAGVPHMPENPLEIAKENCIKVENLEDHSSKSRGVKKEEEKDVGYPMECEETPISIVRKQGSQVNKRKDTPFPIKNTKKNEDFNAVISNRNIYQMEEDDEPVKEANDQDIKEITDDAQNLKIKSKKSAPEKRSKVLKFNEINKVAEVRKPIVIKKKVIKTRTYVQDNKFITEDYSEEEEETIIPTIAAPLGKKQGKQMIFFGFSKS